MSKKRIRAQLHVAMLDPELRLLTSNEPKLKMRSRHDTVPSYGHVYILPATAEAYEQMVEQMACAWHEAAEANLGGNMEICVKRQLRAIGITAPKKGRT